MAELAVEGGLAAKAGEATAVVADRARETVEAVKPAVSTATKAAGKAVNKGAYATGRQIKRASGMFSAFKEEYDKARGVKPGSDDQALAVTDEAEDEGVSAPAKPASGPSSARWPTEWTNTWTMRWGTMPKTACPCG